MLFLLDGPSGPLRGHFAGRLKAGGKEQMGFRGALARLAGGIVIAVLIVLLGA